MPREITMIRVFASSPGDVNAERKALTLVIDEINRWATKAFGMAVDLMTWETHVHPDIGEDAQDVITRQMTDEYDIYIGFMASRFGTPTKRAGSGTEEEFTRAVTRSLSAPKSVIVMFYFKDEPTSPSTLDVKQLDLVKAFQEKVRHSGCLHGTFNSTIEFERMIRVHLILCLTEIAKRQVPRIGSAGSPVNPDATSLPESFHQDFQIYVNHIINGNSDGYHAIKQAVALTNVIQKALIATGRHCQEMRARGFGQVPVMLGLLASMTRSYAECIDILVPDFAESLSRGVTELSKATLLSLRLGSAPVARLNDALEVLSDFPRGIAMTREVIEKGRLAFAGLPKAPEALRLARESMMHSLEAFASELTVAETIYADLATTIRSVIQSAGESREEVT